MKTNTFVKILLIYVAILLNTNFTNYACNIDISAKVNTFNEPKGEFTQINGPYGTTVYDIVADSNDFLYFICYNGLYKSENNGDSWSLKCGDISGTALTLVNDHTIMVCGWGGIYRSKNYGNSWDTVLKIDENLWITDIKSFGNDLIYASLVDFLGTGGVYKSTDGGDNWQLVTFKSTFSLDIDQNGTLYAGTFTHLYKSTDSGETWTIILNCLYYDEIIMSTTTDNSGSIIAVSENDFGTGRIYKSNDYGETWEHCSLINDFHDVILDFEGNIIVCTNSGEVYKSDINCENWTLEFEAYAQVNCIVENSNHDLFIGARNGFGIYRKLIDNPKWENINDSLPYINISALGQFSSGEIIVASYGGAYLSENEGENWCQINQKLYRPNIVSMTITEDDYVFVGTSATGGGAIYKRHISDSVWTESHPPFDIVFSLAHDKNGVLYAGYQSGIIKSIDNGDTWINANNGLAQWVGVYSLECDQNGNVYAATSGGIYISSDHGESWSLFGFKDKNVLFIKIIDDYIYANATGGLYRKASGVDEWVLINNGLNDYTILDLEIDDENIIYLSTSDAKLYYSIDYGNNWLDFPLELQSNTYSIKFLNNSIFFGSNSCGIFKYNKNPNKFNVLAYVKPPNSGFVEGTGYFNVGETVVLSAHAKEGYIFLNWSENDQVVSTQETYIFTLNENRYLHANFSPILGLNNLLSKEITITPNPFSDKISIKLNNINFKNIDIQLINSLGQTVYSKTHNVVNNEININTTTLPAGIYICKVSSGKELISVYKIIKTK